MADQPSRDPNVFPIDTRFQQQARRPGGVARESAIESAQRQIDDMKPGFVDWLDRELKELAAAARLVTSSPADAAAIERAHQASCQLRDVGATMGYELVTFVANNFCSILDAIKAGAPFDRDMVDCHLDALLLARTEPYRHLRPEQVPEMSRGLRRVVELASASAAREAR
ncbi:MAG: hypothetical protein K2Y71_19255 [Xanthobacteraceae bacterium]|nr:hypothetical protein [Xanthobacteraceae bacterium]